VSSSGDGDHVTLAQCVDHEIFSPPKKHQGFKQRPGCYDGCEEERQSPEARETRSDQAEPIQHPKKKQTP